MTTLVSTSPIEHAEEGMSAEEALWIFGKTGISDELMKKLNDYLVRELLAHKEQLQEEVLTVAGVRKENHYKMPTGGKKAGYFFRFIIAPAEDLQNKERQREWRCFLPFGKKGAITDVVEIPVT